jgi:hypothetical protein
VKISKLIPLLAIICVGSARAASILDLSGEEILRQAADLRGQLGLTAAQAGPWLQAEAKIREMLREQKARRERVQIEVREELSQGQVNVDHLAARIDTEDALAQEERRTLRQTWVGVLKGLDESQERRSKEFFRAALDAPTVVQPTSPSHQNPNAEEQPRQRGGRGGRGGGFGSGTGGGLGGGMPKF